MHTISYMYTYCIRSKRKRTEEIAEKDPVLAAKMAERLKRFNKAE